MASGGKKKTTFAKLAREQKLRERRVDKQAKKDARKRSSEMDPEQLSDSTSETEVAGSVEPIR
jgi:hypothetical protein